ncbi:MAG: glycosyltransferase family 39 protein [Anaerolineae bacterium]|nr:glycosyltransferase family 39 protein [Anaerolineae bacterium]
MKDTYRLILALIVTAYVLLGGLYAALTPAWQVPDEPAHYNYVRAIAEEGAFPVMERGDYDPAYLEQLTSQQFPADMPIDAITYEDHQPPLYYLLAAPVYILFDGALLPLRLVSVAVGAALLVIVYGLTRSLFPAQPFLAIAAAALVAFLPQHIAMTAGVENDALAELWIGAALWMAVRYVQRKSGGRQFLVGWGLTLGLGMLTKVSTYVVLPVSLLAIWLRARREEGGRSLGQSLRAAAPRWAWMMLAVVLLTAPWFARSISLYGWSDPIGQARHNSVVVGQLTTVDALAQYGWGWLLGRFAHFTFQSFWGQFGWMGVPLQPAIYGVLAILSLLLLAGAAGWLFDRCRPRLAAAQRDGLILLATSAVLTLLLYLAYNVTFVQHQGRYLFPALIPLAVSAALGIDWLLAPRTARRAAAALAALGIGMAAWGVARGDLPVLPIRSALGAALLLGVAAYFPRWGRGLALAALATALVALDLYALFGAIIPALT